MPVYYARKRYPRRLRELYEANKLQSEERAINRVIEKLDRDERIPGYSFATGTTYNLATGPTFTARYVPPSHFKLTKTGKIVAVDIETLPRGKRKNGKRR